MPPMAFGKGNVLAVTAPLEYLINHVFLPPKTPQEDDINIEQEHNVISSLLLSVRMFSKVYQATESKKFSRVVRMLERLLRMKPGLEDINKAYAVKKVIEELKDGECALFHIQAQNAGLLMTGQENDILVEAFELLAPNNTVMSCQGRLIREFPDCAVVVDRSVFHDDSFLDEFAKMLCQLELGEGSVARPKTKKSGQEFDETREIVSPILVTNMVMGSLAGLGQTAKPRVVTKKSREQVNWDSALLPFRRSPTWLLLRVALRMVLDRQAENATVSLYKSVTTFHHGCILQQAILAGLESDIRFSMSAKLARRIAKLNPQTMEPWLQQTRKILAANHEELQSRWRSAQTRDMNVKENQLAQLRFEPDSILRLQRLHQHLSWTKSRSVANIGAAGPGDKTLSVKFLASNLPSLTGAANMESFVLLEFEAWIELNLSSWVTSHLQDHGRDVEHDLQKIQTLVHQYFTKASASYTGNPEALSLMYLNIMELWVALDKIAGNAVPLLLDYNPGFTAHVFESLILPTEKQMARLLAVETYLASRKRNASNRYPGVFANFGEAGSFAVRYFESSVAHQRLLERIEEEAEKMHTEKIREYHRLRDEYDDLSSWKAMTAHEHDWDNYQARYVCVRWCQACRLQNKMSQIKIDILEWPLPDNTTLSKAIVFEISVPKLVVIWRDVTTTLFLDVFRDQVEEHRAERLWRAEHHSGLQPFVSSTSQVQLASTIKPVEASHYRGKHITNVTESDLCVRHPRFHYTYYEINRQITGNAVLANSHVPAKCSHAEHQHQSHLQAWTRSTTHTSNAIIAAQSSCPGDMSLEEFRAFGHLRSGVRLQWANVLCHLIMPSLNWNQESTYFLVLQACLEAGPASSDGSVLREAHDDLLNEEFVGRMVVALEEALERFRENWQNDTAVSLLACLATRMLFLARSPAHVDFLMAFLSRIREVTMQWARMLLDKRASSSSGEARKNLDQRILMTALTCMSTFDVKVSLLNALFKSPTELCTFVKAAILSQDHSPAASHVSNPVLRILLHRWRRVMHSSSELVKKEVVKQRNTGLGDAIHEFWTDFSHSGTRWSALPGNKQHIVESHTRKPGGIIIPITFNLLEGRLLVNGCPLSRLPQEYEKHPTYSQLFGDQVLEVMPSTIEGMQFSACRQQQGWALHFAMIESELVIQAVRQRKMSSASKAASLEIWEFIPSYKLSGDIPASFTRKFSHWLNRDSGYIEFRPSSSPWISSSDNWLLFKEDGHSVLKRDGCYLIEPQSDTGKVLSEVLRPIELSKHLDIIFHPDNGTVILELPRFSLSFMLKEGGTSIKSKHYAGMCIDQCQGFGSLVGLQTKLVLAQEGVSNLSSLTRMVLVPRGTLSPKKTSHHVEVEVELPDTLHIRHDAFTIDPMLGQITTSGALSSRLYLCMLHAHTSHCLPDPLTGRTGTEEALRILKSAAVWSFPRLDEESLQLLHKIAGIAPQRRFYPVHLKNMEQVQWSDKLPVLSQDDTFLPIVESILAHARDCELLHHSDGPKSKAASLSPVDRSVKSLVQRARIRSATFRVSEYGAEEHTTRKDSMYHGRHHEHQNTSPKMFSRTRLVTRSLVSASQQLVESPSARLRENIVRVTGQTFERYPQVNISFDLKHLRPNSFVNLWCGLHSELTRESNKYKIAFFLSGLIHSEDESWDVVQALMAIANVPTKFRTKIKPPAETPFDLSYSMGSLHHIAKGIIQQYARGIDQCPESMMPQQQGESVRSAKKRRHSAWRSKSDELVREFLSDLAAQWGRGWTVEPPNARDYSSHLSVNEIMLGVRDAVELARKTSLFESYLDDFVKELQKMDCLPAEDTEVPDTSTPGSNGSPKPAPLVFVQASSLFLRPAPSTCRPQPAAFQDLYTESPQTVGDGRPLANLLDQVLQLSGQHSYQASYVNQLKGSSESKTIPRYQLTENSANLSSLFEEHLLKCREETEVLRNSIYKSLDGNSLAEQICQATSLYPRISPVFFLQRLTRTFWKNLPMDWRTCLVNYGLSLAYLQRAERLVNISRLPDRRNDLLKELINTGCHGCDEGDPLNYPEGLLLELENRILIRHVQQMIAAKMRDPPGGENCVMQLNMGEGKSSVIVPIVSVALGNGKQLVRVVVAKPQSKQMMHTLSCTLGGLINRRVFYLPASRAVRLTADEVLVVEKMLNTCKAEGGVLLVQPEHLLSFKLMGLENIWGGGTRPDTLTTYRRFEDSSRDIVDESDENFSVKFELIYTMGSQRPIDMGPDRWTIIQGLMDVVLDVAKDLANGGDEGIRSGLLFEEDTASGRFPTIRVLEEATGKHLISAVAEQVCRTGLRGFAIQHQSKQMRQAVLSYIVNFDLESEHILAVEDASMGFFHNPQTKNALLLLRGLLASGVLSFALGQKRFRVNYGIARDRRPPTMLAVPYRAKDSPAPRSEFSHPDVIIVLTCLSYYYQGLSDKELETCLKKLNDSDQAEQEYARWAAASPQLPPSLRHFSAVNLKDRTLCKGTIFPALRYAKPAVDFYLANLVFPKEMREFPSKLSASGWDLGKTKPQPLTGFSGTTDSKYVLPLSVKALDLPEQQHTNSAVLACILRQENNVLELGGGQAQLSALTVEMLLAAVTTSTQPMRVILDVGAQIIELSNIQVAQRWLELVPSQEADAVIFFNDQDELSVLTRNGIVDPFLTSPFAAQTNRCLVFLDQAHTRGTDLRLPDSYRAAVTLGPGITKDTLVQACMRMRKLGSGQSVTFCVSSEMQKRIRSLDTVDKNKPLTVTDVLVWSIVETCDDAHRSLLLWATQGLRHQRQEAIWERTDKAGYFSKADVEEYLDDEAQSLEHRYRPLGKHNGSSNVQGISAQLNEAMKLGTREDQVRGIRDKCMEFGLSNLDSMGNLQEEQERELAPEVERERQVERPPPRTPASHQLHEDIRSFAVSGTLNAKSRAIIPAFNALADSSASKHFPAANFPSDLLVTADFVQTVQTVKYNDSSSCSDEYQRPVQWLLTQSVNESDARYGMRMVIVSAWEANKLKTLLESNPPASNPVLLRAYLPRTSLSFRSLEDLSTYNVPANTGSSSPPAPPPEELITQLNLFAGQLYLQSYEEYIRVCQYLGLSYRENDGDEDIAADGFVGKNGGCGYEKCRFERSPVAFLGVLYKRIRRDCQDIEKTHMGRILAGEILRERDFVANRQNGVKMEVEQ